MFAAEEGTQQSEKDAGYILPAVDMPQQQASQTPGLNLPARANNEADIKSIAPNIFRNFRNNIWLLWAIVALVLFVCKTMRYLCFIRLINRGNKEITDAETLAIYKDEKIKAGIKRNIRPYINRQAASSMLAGIIRPSVILPVLNFKNHELRQILRHEFVHYKRLDFLYKWVTQIALCLHWFNPLMYIAAGKIDACCELSCDEAVIQYLDEEGRAVYGDALMASLKAQRDRSYFNASLSMSRNLNSIKERLDMIMDYKKKPKTAALTAVILTALIFCGAAFTGTFAFAAETETNNYGQIHKTLDGENIHTTYSSEVDGKNEVSQTVYPDINLTEFAKQFSFENSGEDYFSAHRIDVADQDGYVYQAMVFMCGGTDDYTRTFKAEIEKLSAAYPGGANKISGYLDLILDNRLRNFGLGSFAAIEKVLLEDTDISGRDTYLYEAYVIAVCGSDEFEKPYKEFFDALEAAYLTSAAQ